LVGTNACGIPTNDKQVVVAIPSPIFNNDTDGTHCGEVHSSLIPNMTVLDASLQTAWVFGRIGSYFYDWIEATVVDYCRGETVNDTRCDSDNSTTIGKWRNISTSDYFYSLHFLCRAVSYSVGIFK
jgi:hypothetical protein